eukprot:843013-Amphidinium_carterae.1
MPKAIAVACRPAPANVFCDPMSFTPFRTQESDRGSVMAWICGNPGLKMIWIAVCVVHVG